ncbi:hypothetical protein BGX33_011167 [Mortierella sp. NVP41]|nr:hypothetical protein BGX33_011167 [Mortierella sp. NVP41]
MVSSMLLPIATADATTDSPGAIILGGLGSMVPKPASPAASYLSPGMANITSVGVFVNSTTLITFQATGSIKNPFSEIPLPLSQAGFSVSLDGQNVANITAYNLTLPGGTGPVNLNATISLPSGSEAPNPVIQASFNNLVTNLVGKTTPNGPPPVLVISDFKVSGVNMGLAPITIPVQSTSAPALPSTPGTIQPPPIVGLWGILNPNITLEMPTIKKLVIKAASGGQLTAGAAFAWNNPLNVALDIPYISVDLGLNGTRIATVGIHDIQLAPGPMTADTLVDLKFNNDPQASIQLAAFVHDFLAGELRQILNVGNLTFGTANDTSATGTIFNTLFSGVTVDLPLMGVNAIAIRQLVLGFIGPYIPFPIDISGSSGSSLLSYIQSLAISTAPGHTLLIQPKIQLSFPFQLDLNILYLALDINLDNNILGQLFLTDLVGTGQGQVSVSVGIGLVLSEPAPSIPGIVAQLVDGVDLAVGVSNLAIGVSPSDAINTLNSLGIAAPISSVITGSLGTGNFIDSFNVTVAKNAISITVGKLAELTIHQASINVLPDNLVTAAISLEVFLGLPVVANIGYIGIQAQMDGAQLADISMNSGLSYAGGRVQMDADVALSVGTGPVISGKVAALVNAVLAKQPVTGTVGISDIVIGHSSTDLINALSGISVQLPLGGLIGGVAFPSLPASFLDSTLAQLGLAVFDLSLATIPNAGLRVGARATFSNPIPISVSVPFIGISGGLDNVDLVTVGVNNLALVPGANSLQAQIDLNFNNAANAQTKLATLLGELLGGQLGNTLELLTVHNLRIGASPTDYFDILSQIEFLIPSKYILTKANLYAIAAKLCLSSIQLSGVLLDKLKIGAISANLDKAPVIDLGTSISVSNVSLNAEVSIGYFGIDLALDSHALTHVDVPSISLTTANNKLTLMIQASAIVKDTPEIQTDIANIVNYFMTDITTIPVNSLVFSKPVLGVSTTDDIQTFSLIQFPVALPELLAKARVTISRWFTGAGGLDLNNIALSGVVLDLNNPSIIGVQGGVQVKDFALPADISISYAGVSLGLDTAPLADLTIPSLVLTSTNNQLLIDFKATLNLQQGQAASSQVAKLFGAVLSPGQVTPPTNLVIYNTVFGGDPEHLFHILSQVKLNIALAPYLQKIGTFLTGVSGGNLLAGLDIGALTVDLNNPQTIGIDTTIALKNITIPAEIKLNYVGFNLAINTVPLAQVSVPQFNFKSANGVLSITAHAEVALLTSKELTSAINNFIGAVINNQNIPATTDLVLSGTIFGGSPTNVFTILQGLATPIDISPFIAKIGGLLGGTGSLFEGVGLTGLAIDLNQAPNIGIDANIAIRNLALPAQLSVGYIGLSIAVNNVPLAKFSIPKIQFGTSGSALTIGTHIDVTLQETETTQTLVAGLVNALVVDQVPQGTVTFSSIGFGPSENSLYTILQGVQIPIPLSKILTLVPASGDIGNATSILDRLLLESADINMKNPPSIGADLSIALLGYQFDAKLLLSYVGLSAFLDSTPLATVSVPGIILSSGNNQVSLKTNALVNLASGADIQVKIAAITAQMMGNGGAQHVNLVMSNIAFGGSANKGFHILDKVKVSVPLAPYIEKLAGLISDIVGGNGAASSFSITKLDFSATGSNDLSVAVGASIGGIGSKISVQMPYIGLQVSAGSDGFVYPSINNLQLANGKVALTLALPFQPAARKVVASLSSPISQLLFSTVGTVPGSLVVNSIRFGASASQSFDIASKVGLVIELNSVFQKLQSYKSGQNSFHLTDINTALTTTGVQASIALDGPATLGSLPLKLNFPISLSGYYKNDTFAVVQVTSMDLKQSPWAFGTTILPVDPAFGPALSTIVSNGLNGKNIIQDMTVRGLTLGSFTVFGGLAITPPVIILDSSSTSVTQVKPHLSPLGADFSLSYKNTGPVRVDFGFIIILVKEGPTTDVMEIQNIGGPIHLNNVHQNNGNNLIPMNALMKFSFLEFFSIVSSLLNPKDNFQFEFLVKTSGGEAMPWLQDGLSQVPDSVFASLLSAVARSLLSIKFGF